jgi:hypothetical protein
MNYEAWRPALAAFYHANAQTQAAINVGTFNMRLTDSDRLTIDGLKAAVDALDRKQAA